MVKYSKPTEAEQRAYMAATPLACGYLYRWAVNVPGLAGQCPIEHLGESRDNPTVEALLPKGFVSLANGGHSVLGYDLNDLREQLAHGITPCTDMECDSCHDVSDNR